MLFTIKQWRKQSKKLLLPKHLHQNDSCCCRFPWRFWDKKPNKKGKTRKPFIPKDVPKGHTVVYVGDNMKRFVVKIGLVNHPLFVDLLELSRDKYVDDSPTPIKLWIPCHETVFIDVLHKASQNIIPSCFSLGVHILGICW